MVCHMKCIRSLISCNNSSSDTSQNSKAGATLIYPAYALVICCVDLRYYKEPSLAPPILIIRTNPVGNSYSVESKNLFKQQHFSYIYKETTHDIVISIYPKIVFNYLYKQHTPNIGMPYTLYSPPQRSLQSLYCTEL